MSEIAIPKSWAATTLGATLLATTGGGTPSRKVPHYFEGKTPWFTVKDMKSARPNDALEHISDAAIKESATNLIPANTLILATRIALGKAIRPTVACAINQDLKALFFGIGVDPGLILYWVEYQARNIQELGSGTTVSGIRLETLHTLPINLPPAMEQRRITAKLEEVLSELDAGVAEIKAAQKKLGQYRQSLLKAAVEGTLTADWRSHNQPAETGAQLLGRILAERRARWEAKQLAKFKEQGKVPPKDWQSKYLEPTPPVTSNLPILPKGWAWASLEQLTEFITSGSRGWADYYSNQGATFIRSQNINKDVLDLSDIAFVSPPTSSEGARTLVKYGDLLLTITGANVGKAAQVNVELDEGYVSQHVALIRLIDLSFSGYLHLFLTAGAGGRRQLDKYAYGAGKPGLNLQQVGSVTVPIPPMQEIQAMMEIISTQLTELRAQEIAIITTLKQAAAQRKNILKAAFAGQLVPQDPNDEPASVLLARIRDARDARAERATQAKVKKPRANKTL